MKQLLILFLLFIISLPVTAQGEANNWYFGSRAGVTFNTTPPTALTNGLLATSEGCSSISDSNGNLLFYTDGRTVWNRSHNIMTNADYFGGTGLLGDPSSTSSGLIVPHPTNSDLYYIFAVDEPHHDNAAAFPNAGPANQDGTPTSDGRYTDIPGMVPAADDGFNNGFTYSLVDMTLNGGLGNVVSNEKNIELVTYDTSVSNAIKYKCSEKITAVRGADCNSFWVLTHFVNAFYAFKIDASGVDTTPIKSVVGTNIPFASYRRAAIGYLKASPDGEKLVLAHNTKNYRPVNGTTDSGDGGVYLYDFDEATGMVSNEIALIEDVNAYSVEFSPNSERVFATYRTPNQFSPLHQWDLTAADIPASRRAIDGPPINGTFGIQQGPNAKLYLAVNGDTVLHVINDPNELGNAVNYSSNLNNGAVSLNGRTSSLGLPPFIQSIFNTRIDIVNISDEISTNLPLCDAETFTLSYDLLPAATYTWYQNDILLPGEITNELDISQPNGVTLPYTETYRLEVDPNNGECPFIGIANVTYNENPTISSIPTNETLCDTDNSGSESFDLRTKDSEVLGAQDPTVFSVHYFSTLANANTNENELNPVVDVSNTTTFYVRVHNNNNPNCYVLSEFDIQVIATPIAEPVSDMEFCDNANDGDDTNGMVAFDLSQLNATIYGQQDSSIFDLSYHYSQAEANSGMSPIDASNYIINQSETIFARLALNDPNLCPSTGIDTTSFTLTVNPLPTVVNAELVQCQDENETLGISQFNLNQANALVSSTPSVTFAYYEDAALTMPINANDYTNTINNQIVYVEVSSQPEECTRIAEVTLRVENRNANDTEIQTCGDNLGFGTFDLTEAENDILMGLDPNLNLAYYFSYDDALLEQNPLTTPYDNSQAFSQVVYARVEDNNNECFGISEVTLTVNTPPQLEPDETVIYCIEELPQPITLQSGVLGNPNNYTYEWMPSGETTESIQTTDFLTHTVTVTEISTTCINSRSITVEPSSLAQNISFEVQDLSENNSIMITISETSLGDYEYALDDENGPYQDEPLFTNVGAGIHTVYVRDKNGCGIVRSNEIGIIAFMNFFTPNADGFNDQWRILGITREREANALVYIYDRYGKLLKNFIAGSGSWDGNFNGNPMPSSDYWYHVKLEDGREYRSHFTLKR